MDQLIAEIQLIIHRSWGSAARSINHALTLMFWHIGRAIAEDEQRGNKLAIIDLVDRKTVGWVLSATIKAVGTSVEA